MRLEIHDKTTVLAEQLRKRGVPLDMRCDGRGTCGRCRIRLLSGQWLENGMPVDAPAEALACRTRLLSDAGAVEVPDSSCLPKNDGQFADAWQNLEPMPVLDKVRFCHFYPLARQSLWYRRMCRQNSRSLCLYHRNNR